MKELEKQDRDHRQIASNCPALDAIGKGARQEEHGHLTLEEAVRDAIPRRNGFGYQVLDCGEHKTMIGSMSGFPSWLRLSKATRKEHIPSQ